MSSLRRSSARRTLTPPLWEAPIAAKQRSLWIEAPDEEAGLDLIERLGPLGAGLSPHSRGCRRVAVELRQRVTDDVVIRALDVVFAWVAASGIEEVRLELDGRVHVVRS